MVAAQRHAPNLRPKVSILAPGVVRLHLYAPANYQPVTRKIIAVAVNDSPMDKNALVEFQKWLSAAKPGDRYVYASGLAIMGDIARTTNEGRAWMDKIRPVRVAARAAYVAGQVRLFQKRNGEGFDYIAERTART